MNKKTPISLLLMFLKTEYIRVFFLFLIMAFVGSVSSIDGLLIKKIVDTVESLDLKDGTTGIISKMIIWAFVYAFWWESLNWTFRLYDYLYLSSIPKIKATIIQYFYDHTQSHSHRFFQQNFAGNINNRIMEASRSAEMMFSIFAERIFLRISATFFAALAMYYVNPIFAIIFLIWLVVFVIVNIFASSKVNDYSFKFSRAKSTISGKIVDAISNINSIRMFCGHRFESRYLRGHIDDTVGKEQKMQKFMFKVRWALGTSCSIMIFFMIYNLTNLKARNLITTGDFALVITLCAAFIDDIWDITQAFGDFFEEIGNFNQSISLLEENEIKDRKNATNLLVTDGKIEFRNVVFKYGKDQGNLFSDKSIIIKPKQKVGLVGFSGSGKSTFVSLINRFYEIDSGQILIDGQSVTSVTQDSLRNNISFIPQEPILFHRTIMENIRYAKPSATDEEIYEATKKARIHDLIMSLPQKYDSLCGERGSNLSGGQRQRVVIARAVLKNAPILILDEATSALDTLTERMIQESLDILMQDKTVLVIAHRLSTLLNMDRILVFDNGNIVQDGTHEHLSKTEGIYQDLWKSQIKGFIK
jgi:ATP-binding cassette subfamily B protein